MELKQYPEKLTNIKLIVVHSIGMDDHDKTTDKPITNKANNY